MTYLSRLDIAKEEIKARLTIDQVVTHVVGRQFNRGKMLCPFHNEKTASFTVDTKKGVYHCLGCGASGDMFTFIMQYNGLGFQDSIKWLDIEFNLSLLGQRITVTQQVAARKRKKEQEKKALEEQRKRIEYDMICLDYRICNEALRKGVLEPYSELWCYYIDQKTHLDYLIQEGGY